jgi:hypothetical protein
MPRLCHVVNKLLDDEELLDEDDDDEIDEFITCNFKII